MTLSHRDQLEVAVVIGGEGVVFDLGAGCCLDNSGGVGVFVGVNADDNIDGF